MCEYKEDMKSALSLMRMVLYELFQVCKKVFGYFRIVVFLIC